MEKKKKKNEPAHALKMSWSNSDWFFMGVFFGIHTVYFADSSGQPAGLGPFWQYYLWQTMREDSKEIVRACHWCQIHSNWSSRPAKWILLHNLPHTIRPMGMDLLGPFSKAWGENNTLLLSSITLLNR